MRTMYDSVNPQAIPANAEMVAGYIDHPLYTWSEVTWQRFTKAVKVRIAVKASTNDGHVLDVERSDATPQQAPSWANMRRASGFTFPTIYCSLSNWVAVQSAFESQKVAEPQYWIADYDNVTALWPNAVAKQYIDPPRSGGDYDLSIVRDYWPGVDELPTYEDDNMILVNTYSPTSGGGTGQYLVDTRSGLCVPCNSVKESSGVPTLLINDNDFTALQSALAKIANAQST